MAIIWKVALLIVFIGYVYFTIKHKHKYKREPMSWRRGKTAARKHTKTQLFYMRMLYHSYHRPHIIKLAEWYIQQTYFIYSFTHDKIPWFILMCHCYNLHQMYTLALYNKYIRKITHLLPFNRAMTRHETQKRQNIAMIMKYNLPNERTSKRTN